MAAEDYIDFDFFDDKRICIHAQTNCGQDNLEWEEVRGAHNRKKWVLVDERGEIHDCRGAAGAKEFPIVKP